MQRWHLTVGLGGLVLIAAAIAPTLSARVADSPPPVVDPTPPIPQPVVVVEPVAPSTPDGHLVVTASLDRTAVLAGSGNERFLAITVSAPSELGESFRRPVDLGVVMDTSGSMTSRGKIDYAKRAAKMLASSMEEGDVYSLVTFSDDATTIVPATKIYDPASIHDAVDRILEGGGTNLYAGLEKGAGEVRRSLNEGAVGRVVLLSDGKANVGVIDPESLRRYAAMLSSQGVSVSTVGLGLDYNEDLLAEIAEIGGGTYDFVDNPKELQTVFVDELDRTAAVVARETTLRIDLPTGVHGFEVIGWDAEASGTGWNVRLGDIYAGESRTIVARVRVDAPQNADTLPVAAITADYHDLIDAQLAQTVTDAAATVTTSHAAIDASTDRTAAINANSAWGNYYLNLSARAYADGDVAKAQELAAEGGEVLKTAADAYGDESLARDAENTVRQRQIYGAYRPSSAQGLTAIKGGKEHARKAVGH